MIQQKQQEGLTRLGRESVDVIQDQNRVVLEQALKVVEEAGQHLFVLGGMPGPLRLSPDVQARLGTPQRRDPRGTDAPHAALPLPPAKPRPPPPRPGPPLTPQP